MTTSARAGPAPKTVCVALAKSGQPSQCFAASRSDERSCCDGRKAAAVGNAFCMPHYTCNGCAKCSRPLPLQLVLEVAETGPIQPFIEIDLGDDNVAPVFGLDQSITGMIEDGRRHPLRRGIAVGAGHEVNMVFA